MNSKHWVLTGAIAFVVGITVLQWFFNIREVGPQRDHLSTRFRVGFLPVT